MSSSVSSRGATRSGGGPTTRGTTAAKGSARVGLVPDTPSRFPDFVSWPSFPFEGDLRLKPLEPVADAEPPREGEDASDCVACNAKDEAYIWVSERWRVPPMDRPTGRPLVPILGSAPPP